MEWRKRVAGKQRDGLSDAHYLSDKAPPQPCRPLTSQPHRAGGGSKRVLNLINQH